MVARDASQKMLFSHPLMMAGLLELGVDEDWVRQLDLSRLKHVPARHISKNLFKRRGDIAWKAKYPGGQVYILLEFQSRVDHTAVVRQCAAPGGNGALTLPGQAFARSTVAQRRDAVCGAVTRRSAADSCISVEQTRCGPACLRQVSDHPGINCAVLKEFR